MQGIDAKSSRIEALALGLMGAFFLIALALGYWVVVRAPALAQRGDNPRVVDAELQIRRGRILDANGIVLAETVGSEGAPVRRYPIPSVGPAIGYYSFRYGTAGIEQGYDNILRGNTDDSWKAFWRDALHQPRIGQDIRLTIDADWQRESQALMSGKTGALLILSVPDAAVKVMVSQPGYDPNRLDEQFSALAEDVQAPLLNRATQGFYQPGLALQPFILAAALDRRMIELDARVENADASVAVRNLIVRCREMPPNDATWATVLQTACPAPMADLAEQFASQELTQSLRQFGFYDQPVFPIQTTEVTSLDVSNTERAILGQEALAVTPLQMARAWISLANGGTLPSPYLVAEVQNAAGAWQAAPILDLNVQAVDAAAARAILNALGQGEGNTLEHAVTALSGPQEATIAWYLGFAPVQQPRYAIVVIVESAADASSAREVGRAALELAPAAPQ